MLPFLAMRSPSLELARMTRCLELLKSFISMCSLTSFPSLSRRARKRYQSRLRQKCRYHQRLVLPRLKVGGNRLLTSDLHIMIPLSLRRINVSHLLGVLLLANLRGLYAITGNVGGA